MLLQGNDLLTGLGFSQQSRLLLDLNGILRIAHPLNGEPPLRFERIEVGLCGLDVDEPINERHPLGIPFSQEPSA